jgi:uncharacterized protein YjbI with pentapeptide repeats
VVSDGNLYVGPISEPDKYRLKRQVGGGGEALLWEAEINVSGVWEPVAIKVLRVERSADLDQWGSRWAEQAEVLRFIRHPGVVGVREHFVGGGMHYAGEEPAGPTGLYLAMNWVGGQTLRDWTLSHREANSEFEALILLAQTADVLDWLHSGQATPSGRPVVHADVTANNIVVTPSGQAVLVDFGLARLAAGLSATVEGTGGYLAPEVRAAGAYSPASDRYAFGALTYFMLTGMAAPNSLPEIRAGLEAAYSAGWRAGSVEQLMVMFDPDPHVRPACGPWIRAFTVSDATFVDAGGPPRLAPVAVGAAAGVLAAGLDATGVMAAAAGSTAEFPAVTKAAVRRRKRRSALVGVLVALALAAAGVAGYAITRHRKADASGAGSTTTTAETTTSVGSGGPVPDSSTTTPAATTQTTVASSTQQCTGNTCAGSDISGRNLQSVSLPNVVLRDSTMVHTDLTGADLTGADMTGARANNAIFVNAVLVNVILVNVNLQGANLTGANLAGANLQNVQFKGAILAGADFRGTINFSWSSFLGANMIGMILPNGNVYQLPTTGDEVVRKAQRFSNIVGLADHLAEDGLAGPATFLAFQSFQQKLQLPRTDGQLDQPTLDTLSAMAFADVFGGQWDGATDPYSPTLPNAAFTVLLNGAVSTGLTASTGFGGCGGSSGSLGPAVAITDFDGQGFTLTGGGSGSCGVAGTLLLVLTAPDTVRWNFSSGGRVLVTGYLSRTVHQFLGD